MYYINFRIRLVLSLPVHTLGSLLGLFLAWSMILLRGCSADLLREIAVYLSQSVLYNHGKEIQIGACVWDSLSGRACIMQVKEMSQAPTG